MPPENYRYGGGAAQSLIHPLVALFLIAGLICIVCLPRKYSALPMLWIVLLVPSSQQFCIAGLHFFVLRLIILAGIIRAKADPGISGGRTRDTREIDRAFVACTLAQVIAPILLFREAQALIYQIGYLWDWLGGYILVRWIIQDEQDIYRLLKIMAVLLVPVAVGMCIEQKSMFNIFSMLGGLPNTPEVRMGTIRAQGVFEHSLMAGSFGAVLIPLFYLLWKEGRSKVIASVGLIAASTMVFASHGSTALLGYIGGIGAICLWPLRKRMRQLRFLLVGALVGLQIVMKAPVWFLIARVDLTGGSSSYHRAELVDQFIRHFSQWWFIGTNDNASWGLDMFDVQNQYVNAGLAGGIIGLVFFIATISRGFGAVGNIRKCQARTGHGEWVSWLLGCALFANVVVFFGVNFFDQSRFAYLAIISMIAGYSAATAEARARSKPVAARANAVERMDRIPICSLSVSPLGANCITVEKP
jgi:hypothetical protein